MPVEGEQTALETTMDVTPIPPSPALRDLLQLEPCHQGIALRPEQVLRPLKRLQGEGILGPLPGTEGLAFLLLCSLKLLFLEAALMQGLQQGQGDARRATDKE